VREFVRESLDDMEIKEINCDHVAFYDNDPVELVQISDWF